MTINYTSAPSRTSFLLNKVGLFDEYLAFRESDTVESILVGEFDKDNHFTGTKYTLTSTRSGTQTIYEVSSREYTDEPVTVQHEYYTYSNIGIGQQGQIYQQQQILSGTMVIMLGIVVGYMILKGAGGIWRYFARK